MLGKDTDAQTGDSNPVESYIDLQVNGFVGVDFNAPDTTLQQLLTAARAMRAEGVLVALPTVITADLDVMCQCISNIRTAIDSNPEVASVFGGIHIEGPFLSPESGYIGAHPVRFALPSDQRVLERLLDAAGPWAKLLTLAPEIDSRGDLTRLAVQRGVIVAAGHTNASLDQLECCINAGMRMFTHLGNGCPRLMDRHDNIIYRALRYHQILTYSLIADGFHIPQTLFENLLEWVANERLLVVSDAMSATGLGPGTFQLGERRVKIGPDKAARDASGEHFVGAASSMRDADRWLSNCLQLSLESRRKLLFDNPAKLLNIPLG